MTKKKVFILFIISFVAGFILNDMARITFFKAQERVDERIKKDYAESQSPLNKVPYEFIRWEVPNKAIRGYGMEMAAWIKAKENHPARCELLIKLVDAQNKIRSINRFPLEPNKEIAKGEIIQLGPLKIQLPETVPPGKYNLEIEITLTEPVGGISSSIYLKGRQIEIVSLKQ